MKEIKSNLFKCLQERLSDAGFRFIKSKDGFIRKTSFGQQWYTFLFYTYEGVEGVEVNPVIQIRFEEVEIMFHETSSFSEKDSKGTSTIGCSIENYLGDCSDSFRQKIVDNNDVEAACSFFYRLFQETGERFFSDYTTLNDLDLLINSEPKSELVLIHPIFRGSKGLIIDHLLGGKNREFLTDVYSDSYTEFANGFYKPDYEGVIKNIISKLS